MIGELSWANNAIALQEHWLDSRLIGLVFHGISGMSERLSTSNHHDRPFGGAAFLLVKMTIAKNVLIIKADSDDRCFAILRHIQDLD
jgi:hypothetical protein